MANKVLVTIFFNVGEILSAILFQNERGLKAIEKTKRLHLARPKGVIRTSMVL